jgi:hypothetical protein
MRKITVTVQNETYRQFRAWCAQRDTCVSHVVQAFLNDLPRMQDVGRFPLPEAPDPRSLGELFNRLDLSEADKVRLKLAGLA